ncbi:MAG: MBL fold metallo-hydrolase [Lachnospiraceae bacterium]|nr:MBL fold metallo-hydrolase [Lachnospiraceae bacterium]
MADLRIGRMVLGVYGTNCYLVYKENGNEALVVDPPDRGEQIYQALTEKGFTVVGILLTHGHFDHVWGVEELRRLTGAKLYALEEERELCANPSMNVSADAGRPCSITADEYLHDGEELSIAGMTCKVLATPGHTAGSCCYYFEQGGFVICGDTIFFESVGRTDFPTGNAATLTTSIREKIFTLPGEVQLYPGHGESTTVEHEKKYNPYVGVEETL